MTITQAEDAIGKALNEVVAGLHPTPAVVQWDNVTDPETDPASPDDTWLQIAFEPVGGQQTSVGSGTEGSGKFRRTGLVMIRIFTPPKEGKVTSNAVAQQFLDAMEGRSSSGVWYENVRPVHRGRFRNWYEQRVVADYFYDDHK